MCQTKAQGGKRCSAHTKQKLDRAMERLRFAHTQLGACVEGTQAHADAQRRVQEAVMNKNYWLEAHLLTSEGEADLLAAQERATAQGKAEKAARLEAVRVRKAMERQAEAQARAQQKQSQAMAKAMQVEDAARAKARAQRATSLIDAARAGIRTARKVDRAVNKVMPKFR